MSSWQSGDIEAHGIRLHYTRTGGANMGGAKLPLVLAHGFSDDGLCWTPVAEALASDYDVIMVDARGHGRSDAPEQGYGPIEHAADLHGVITALGLQRPAVLGHSMGGATALVLAGTYPEVPGAILVEDAGPFGMKSPALADGNAQSDAAPTDEERIAAERQAQEQRRVGMPAWISELKGKTREELIAGQRAQTPHWSEAELGFWADSKLRLSPKVLNRSDAAPVDWLTILRRITCPTLLITADPARGAMITEQSAREFQAMVPQLRIAHVPEAGHSIHRDQFDRYMEVVRAFLQQVTSP
ncbi:MAG: alpha/beta hydrolase [Armatimonadota bacterium]|nr:alpha/beta hydrolase [Armatimonadota bacterium]